MSEFSRRSLVQLTALPLAAQEHNHGEVPASPKPARTNFFTSPEFETLQVLCDLILPADEVSPAASATGAAEYIELLSSNNSRLAKTFRGGLAWLNSQAYMLAGDSFAKLPAARQTELLDRIADHRRAAHSDAPGVEFFDWARRLTVDAYYTSPSGYRDVDYKGGKGMTTYQVPAAALEQALTKAKLK
ncbi:MAG: gluconate 2-dehydrogenase subunit 3 family protein [Acidobacteria bacterium]|nr:gluconate 2-dehydrogenase subunit 3 family protein [Acidobacteriota bacterium]